MPESERNDLVAEAEVLFAEPVYQKDIVAPWLSQLAAARQAYLQQKTLERIAATLLYQMLEEGIAAALADPDFITECGKLSPGRIVISPIRQFYAELSERGAKATKLLASPSVLNALTANSAYMTRSANPKALLTVLRSLLLSCSEVRDAAKYKDLDLIIESRRKPLATSVEAWLCVTFKV